MNHLSQLFKDRPQHPMETAVYWLEYVIKYKGAKHLRSAALELSWYQYLLLDVIGFLILSSICVFFMLKRFLRHLFSKTSTNKDPEIKCENPNVINNNHIYQNGNGYTKSNGYTTMYQNGYPNHNGTIQLDKVTYSAYHSKDE